MTIPDRRLGVVVDAYTTGNLLPAAFARYDVGLVHVQSTRELSDALPRPDLSRFVDNIVFDGAGALDRIRSCRPAFVIAGQDPGVPLADRLSERLGLPSNGSALSVYRRDKYEMIERVRAAGLHCARQFKSGDPAALLRWAKEHAVAPAVVKPLSSAGTDRVFICRRDDEIEAAAQAVLARPDIYGQPNTEVLIQSHLDGTEYIVDTVSRDGRRYVCGVWRYHKTLLPGGQRIYDRDVLVAPDEDAVPRLVDYVDSVLTLLDIRHGSAHAEVMLTAQGPALVEIAPRMNGNMNPAFHDVCLGHNQADLTALAYLRPGAFRERYAGRGYRRRQPAVVYNAPTAARGRVAAVDRAVVDRIEALPSVHSVAVKLRPGDRIRPTTDLLSSPLRVFLTAATEGQIMADYAAVRDLKDRVYRVGPGR